MVQITLNLSQQIYEQLKEFADDKNLSVEQALEQAAENIEAVFDKISDMSLLSDRVVMQLANARMDAAEDDRLYELQHMDSLTAEEAQELLKLKSKAWEGQLIKSKAMLEAKKRGLLNNI